MISEKASKNIISVATYAYSLDDTKKADILGGILGRFNQKEIDKQLSQYKIKDIDTWSVKEKYIFSLILKNNSKANDIVFAYNRRFKNVDTEKRMDLFKNLHIMSKFLQAYPYNSGLFPKKAFSHAIDWYVEGKSKKIDDFVSGLKLFVDINTLDEFMSPDINKREASATFIKSKKQLELDKNRKNIYKVGASILGAAVVTGLTADMILSSGALSTVMNFVTSYTTSQLVYPVVGFSVLTLAAVKSFGFLFKAVNKFADIHHNRSILNSKPEKFQKTFVTKYINNRLISDLIVRNNFNLENEDNKKYIYLTALLSEKSVNPSFVITSEIKERLNIDDEQVKRLQNLHARDIHEIINLSSPFARSLMALNKLTNVQKTIIRNISMLEELNGQENNKENQSGFYFERFNFDKSQKLHHSINIEIENMSKLNQQLCFLYLNGNKNKDGSYKEPVVRRLRENLRNGKSIEEIILSETSLELRDKTDELKEKPQSLLSVNINRVKNVITGRENIDYNKTATFLELDGFVKEMGLRNTERILKEYRPIDVVLKETINHVSNLFKDKIKNIRGVFAREKNKLEP